MFHVIAMFGVVEFDSNLEGISYFLFMKRVIRYPNKCWVSFEDSSHVGETSHGLHCIEAKGFLYDLFRWKQHR